MTRIGLIVLVLRPKRTRTSFFTASLMNTTDGSSILPGVSKKPKRVYVFVVTSLALFLASLAIWRIPIAGYTSQVIIGYDVGSQFQEPSSISSTFITSKIIQPERLYAAAQIAGIAHGAETIEEARPTLDKLASRIESTVVPHVNDGEYLINVKAFDTDQDVALHLVDHLARSFVADFREELDDQSLDSVATDAALREQSERERELAAAKEQLSAAREELDNFFDQHITVDSVSTPLAAASAKETSPRSRPPVRRQENPRWNELRERLGQLEAMRVDLLVDKTSAHPDVVELDRRINTVQEFLQSTERYIDAPGIVEGMVESAPTMAGVDGPSEERSSEENVDGEPLAENEEEQRALLMGQYQSLKESLDAAQEQYDAALSASRQPIIAEDPPESPRIWIEQSARIAQHHGGSPGVSRLAGLVVPSLLVALLASVFASAPIVNENLTSLKEVGQRLQLPVIGTR